MTNTTLHITCTTPTGEQSTALITVVDTDLLELEGSFTATTIDGYDIMFWFAEYLHGTETDLKFTSKSNAKTSMVSLDSIKASLATLSICDESAYNNLLNEPSVKLLANRVFVDCHEYGEAYYICDKLVAYAEIYCMGKDVYYILK